MHSPELQFALPLYMCNPGCVICAKMYSEYEIKMMMKMGTTYKYNEWSIHSSNKEYKANRKTKTHWKLIYNYKQR